MKHKIYLLLMILLPLFVGFKACIELVRYLTGNAIYINPVICFLLAIAGITTGVRNVWNLID